MAEPHHYVKHFREETTDHPENHPKGLLVLHLTNAQADRLARTIEHVVPQLQTLAVEHSYRADACRFVGERNLAAYHTGSHEAALDSARSLENLTAGLRKRDAAALS